MAELLCQVCHRRYVGEARHVATDAHLEAMADESINEWLALPPGHPIARGFALQIARMEYFYDQHTAWRMAMGLPDTPDTDLLARRIRWCWIRAMALDDFDQRMAYARAEMEYLMERSDT